MDLVIDANILFAALIKESVTSDILFRHRLYAPEFIYVVPKTLQGIHLGALTTPSERFQNVYQWYTNTEHVWSFFANGNQI